MPLSLWFYRLFLLQVRDAMWIVFFGHLTYVLLAVSYLVRDLVWLRMIAIPASLCSIIFNYFAPAQPLWLIINWNLVFLAVNTVQLVVLQRNFRRVQSTTALSELAEFLSPPLSSSEVIRMYEWAERVEIDRPTEILSEGQAAKYLYLVLKGRARIHRAGEYLGDGSRGTLLGEISFLTEQPCSATVAVESGSMMLRWNQRALCARLSHAPNLKSAWQQCLATHMSRQFTQRELKNIEQRESSKPTGSCTDSITDELAETHP